MRFVIADDGKHPRERLHRILVEAGHDVVGIGVNGREAIDLCRRNRPDVAVLDVSMPVLTGDVAARTIIAERLADHVMIASSMSLDSIFGPLREAGCLIVSKPYYPEQLLRELEAIL